MLGHRMVLHSTHMYYTLKCLPNVTRVCQMILSGCSMVNAIFPGDQVWHNWGGGSV